MQDIVDGRDYLSTHDRMLICWGLLDDFLQALEKQQTHSKGLAGSVSHAVEQLEELNDLSQDIVRLIVVLLCTNIFTSEKLTRKELRDDTVLENDGRTVSQQLQQAKDFH